MFFFFLSAGKEGRGGHFNASCPAGRREEVCSFVPPYTPATPSQPKPQRHTITPIIVRATPSTNSQDIPESKKKNPKILEVSIIESLPLSKGVQIAGSFFLGGGACFVGGGSGHHHNTGFSGLLKPGGVAGTMWVSPPRSRRGYVLYSSNILSGLMRIEGGSSDAS